MHISRGRQFIFVHIPKTGGTSMALALEDRAMKDDILIGDTPKAQKRKRRLEGVRSSGRLWKHSRLTDIYGLMDDDEIAEFFIFTLVRNPWDRMVSYYSWLRAQRFENPAVTLARDNDFSGFLNHPHTQASVKASPYARYVTDRHGAERCDAYVRLEHLDEDLAPVAGHLGFRLDLPHANRSDRSVSYQEAYSKADQALVAEICAADIAKFGYAFGD